MRIGLSFPIGVMALAIHAAPLAGQSCPGVTITRQALAEAIREARRPPNGDYSLLATTNSVRFQSAVLQRLIERALAERPAGGSFFIPHDVLWWEYLAAAGLDERNAGKAPIGRRLAFEYRQSIEVSFGPADRFVRKVRRGAEPLLAAHVTLTWPDRPDGARRFSFVDSLSVPRLKVTNHQMMTFRFLVFRDMTVLDEIEGISGRPLSGLLGTLFKLIGEGNAVFTRFSISDDGLQILRAKATRMVSRTVTGTINPDGLGQSGVPENRADLLAIEARLKEPLELEYQPHRCWSPPESSNGSRKAN